MSIRFIAIILLVFSHHIYCPSFIVPIPKNEPAEQRIARSRVEYVYAQIQSEIAAERHIAALFRAVLAAVDNVRIKQQINEEVKKGEVIPRRERRLMAKQMRTNFESDVRLDLHSEVAIQTSLNEQDAASNLEKALRQEKDERAQREIETIEQARKKREEAAKKKQEEAERKRLQAVAQAHGHNREYAIKATAQAAHKEAALSSSSLLGRRMGSSFWGSRVGPRTRGGTLSSRFDAFGHSSYAPSSRVPSSSLAAAGLATASSSPASNSADATTDTDEGWEDAFSETASNESDSTDPIVDEQQESDADADR